MGMVSTWLRKKTREQAVAEASQLAAEQVSLEVLVDADIAGLPLTKSQEAAAADMRERGLLDEFESAVAAKRAFLAADQFLTDCITAKHTMREITVAHQQDLDARKIEDARRRKADQDYEAAMHIPRHMVSQIDDARRRLRSALPPGMQAEIADGRATVRGTQAAVHALHRKVIEAVELVDQLKEPEMPSAPLSPTERLLAEYRQRVQMREQTLLAQQKQRDDLAGMRGRLEALQATLAQQQAAQDELERKLLKA